MLLTYKKRLKRVLLSGICIISINTVQADIAASVSFSQYRIVLDEKKRNDKLMLTNTGNQGAKCNLGLNHYSVNEDNSQSQQSDFKKAYNSAKSLLRYSPRSVTIPAGTSQTVRLISRRKSNQVDGEYMSYLRLSCSVIDDNIALGQPTVGARVNYNIPVHIRVGDIQAETNFTIMDITKTNNNYYKLIVRQYRQGNSSLIGDFTATDKQTGSQITAINNLGIYPPAKYMDHVIILKNKPLEGVDINFIPDEKYSVNLVQKLNVEASRF